MSTKRTLPLSALQQYLAELFDDRPHALSRPFTHWLTSSKPFPTFAQTYRQKIRKKVRVAQGTEEIYDLYCELRTAYLLLQEPKFAVEYELHGNRQGRSPDFTVTYRTHTPFHVEVTRLRMSQQERQLYGQGAAAERHDLAENAAFLRLNESRRLTDVVCDKLGQLLPGAPNVLSIWVQSKVVQEIDVEQLMSALTRRVEAKDADLLARHGFRNPADFIRNYRRLSIVLVQSLQTQASDQTPLVWINREAKHPLPAKVADLLGSLIMMDQSLDFSAGHGDEH